MIQSRMENRWWARSRVVTLSHLWWMLVVPCTISPQTPDLTAAVIIRSCPARLPTQALLSLSFGPQNFLEGSGSLLSLQAEAGLKADTSEESYPRGMGVSGHGSRLPLEGQFCGTFCIAPQSSPAGPGPSCPEQSGFSWALLTSSLPRVPAAWDHLLDHSPAP